MSAFEPDRPRRKLPIIGFLLLIVALGLLGGAFYLAPRFEWSSPQIRLPDSDVIGLAPVEIAIGDEGAGLKSVAATLSAGGTEHTLISEQYDQPVSEKKLTIALSSKLAGLKEGPAVLRVTARDASLWNFFRGNETVIEKNLTIDITPPALELIADDRYVNFGGVGAIVYKSSADATTTGVRIGNYFFPGFKGQIKDQPDYFIALFAHPYNVPADAKAVLVATDKAGNSTASAARLRAPEREIQEEHDRRFRELSPEQGRAARAGRRRASGRSERRLRRGQQEAAGRERKADHRDHQQVHALDALEGRVQPAQQLQGGSELRRSPDLRLQQ